MLAMTNHEVIIFRSAQRSGIIVSEDQHNTDWRGVRLFLNITSVSGALPVMDIKVQFRDPATGLYADLPGTTFAQHIATGQDELSIYPGNTAMANRAVSGPLPYSWRVVATITGGTFTFSLGGVLQI